MNRHAKNMTVMLGIVSVVAWFCMNVMAADKTAKTASPAASAKGGARLWSQTCARCHNSRSPETLSDQQWKTVMRHMRVHAYVTAAESRAILEFLKSAN